MVTQAGDNVAVAAVQGNFDDAQNGVKKIFNDTAFNEALAKNQVRLSSANSINWGRLVPQIVYYFSAYADLLDAGRLQLGDEVNFTVPTGNFGDILAGFYAKSMAGIVAAVRCFPVTEPEYQMEGLSDGKRVSFSQGLTACLPFVLIFFLLLFTSKLLPAVHDPLNLIRTTVQIYDGGGNHPYTFTWIATPGVLILLSAFIGGRVQGAGFGEMLGVLRHTVVNLRFTVLTILTVIATAEVMRKYNVAILGATGAVGQEFLNLIEERNFPFAELKMLASKRSAGKIINFMGTTVLSGSADAIAVATGDSTMK